MNSNVSTQDLYPAHLQFPQQLVDERLSSSHGRIDLALLAAERVEAQITPQTRLIVQTDPHGLAADRFRSLRLGLRTLAASSNLKVLLVTSSLPREGKSTTALNLAASLASHGKDSVALVEVDFRHPSLAEYLGLSPGPGLVRALEDGTDPLTAMRIVDPLGFYFLPAGEPAANPFDLLNSDQFARTLQRLRASVDWVILDAPPANPVPDLLAVTSKVDGCLWVLRAGSTPREAMEDGIRQVGANLIVGMVLNEAEGGEHSYAQYRGYGNGLSEASSNTPKIHAPDRAPDRLD